MPQVVFNAEWMLAPALKNLTGMTDRQMKESRSVAWVEGVHFKRVPLTVSNQPENADRKRGLIWYNYPRINQLIQES
ncbi:hypothetical protein EU408_01865 [Salmonella enterica subsp. enterica]|uniref:excisionase family protein n=1 Tax=Salmonella enterica TaxID=28901 RepID=UPI000CCC77A6|nr:excisionase family protein [Salmonella enterica]EBS6311371.1 hypothetical protein [Salmonella enterica subsp. enterica serovar Millesi]EBX4202683.1 hypothetical protein [Salmonella enterica subsp. enterica serovar Oakland]ECI6608928.1 hypothetical protein [Salmonella enterica subsp. enterica]EBI3714119.1 hypothetical protein [Salmonella enterica]EBW7631689.1 hypothetical protein [Salmonella enterica subsp. enterica serovar Millesi]